MALSKGSFTAGASESTAVAANPYRSGVIIQNAGTERFHLAHGDDEPVFGEGRFVDPGGAVLIDEPPFARQKVNVITETDDCAGIYQEV